MNKFWEWARTRPALFAGVLALTINLQGVWLPSFWYDEVFTIHAINRSLDELITLTTTQVDAVHLAYYLFMWAWTSVFGFSELAVRLPSVIAVGIGAYFTSRIAERLFERSSIALASGLVLGFLPMTLIVSTWARSHALQAAVFAALLWVFIRAMDEVLAAKPGPRTIWRWALFSTLLALLIHLTIYASLLIPVFAIWALKLVGLQRWRELVVAWGSLASALGLSTPVLLLAAGQRSQIDWTGRPSFDSIFFDQLFGTTLLAAFIGWSLILAAASYALQGQTSKGHRVSVAFLALSYAIPTVIVAALSWNKLLGQSLYNTKYFHFVAPAMAILMGLGLHLLLRHTSLRSRIAAALAVSILLVPSLERSTKGRDGDWLAGIAAINASEVARAGYWFAADHTSSLLYVYGHKLSEYEDLTRTAEPASGLMSGVIPLEEAVNSARESGQGLFVSYRIVNREKIDDDLRELGVTEVEEIYTDGRFEIVLIR